MDEAQVIYIEDSSSSLSTKSIEFPLPEHLDPKLCRDEFLRQTLLPYNKEQDILLGKNMTKSISDIELRHSITGEAMAILKLIKWKAFVDDGVKIDSSEMSLTLEEKHILCRQYNYKLQIASIEFVLMHLLKTVQICSNMWPGLISTIPNRLFAWSVKHFLYRVNLNQLYLDVLKRSMTYGVMDWYKFKIDCHELCLLIKSILDDVRNGEDLCTSAMQEIRTAYYDEHSEWLPQCGNVREEREQVAKQLRELNFQLKMIDENIKLRSLTKINGSLDTYEPIENRYRLRWAHNIMDQNLYFIDLKNKAIEDELIKLKNAGIVDNYRFECSANTYTTQIESYKLLIYNWQERYDKDLEEGELLCNTTKNSLQKVTDDMKFYREQMEFLTKRIAEVREEIRLEEELALERDRQLLLNAQANAEKQKNAGKTKKKGK